ncbi:MAG: aspartate--ammonia ligase [Lentisphaeria bacterium]|nr:aspartate--ammonia ligase [Lentisphaeria bacterium]MDY0175980.1 aspartate--ammonia ligase [Lentisphaeria bacterium]NLZ60243.1 aspartate--ammonia ligase [Lentisphaerota bacterium]
MSSLYIPPGYQPLLDELQTEDAIGKIKRHFQNNLAFELNLRRVTAPLFVLQGTGINDDLNGVERPVSFEILAMQQSRAEIVHSLAKWKRLKLGKLRANPGEGIYTDMNAIRPDEENLDNIHSIYVDQWDWEKVMREDERHLDYLKQSVRRIYYAIRRTERYICQDYPRLKPFLPEKIEFIHSEDLERQYPKLSAKQREDAVTKEHGAVFIIGIGGTLPISGKSHDGRAPDYDDWSTPTLPGYKGLNGDLLVYNPILKQALELSSMGIRVDKKALLEQLKQRGEEQRLELKWHKALLDGEMPLSIGGGIGQSRLCMLYLQKAHIGEIQASLWPAEIKQRCRENHIPLL